MLSRLRSIVQPIKRTLAWPFLRLRMGPSQVGLFGIACALAAAGCARSGAVQISFGFAIMAFLTDLADGEVARQTGQETPEGNYLDAMGDRICESVLLFGLLPQAPNLVTLALCGGLLVSFAKARCALVCLMDNRDWPGWGDYPDRGALIATAYFCQPHTLWPLTLLAALNWTSLWSRVRHARQMISSSRSQELQPYLRR